MNLQKIIDSDKLYDLYDQIFDYFNLTVYDLESKIDTNLNIKTIKNKLETFSDKHFKNALNEFNQEINKLKDQIPEDFLKIENLSKEIRQTFNDFIDQKFFEDETINILKINLKKSIDKIHKIYS
tara:strand:- start:2499 stop:2873 length:375 start_codon:yes stop_codon:yes gene_type:complete